MDPIAIATAILGLIKSALGIAKDTKDVAGAGKHDQRPAKPEPPPIVLLGITSRPMLTTVDFLDREAELARLGHLLAEGRGVIWVTGPPQSGKSALVSRYVRDNGLEASSARFELSGGAALQPLLEGMNAFLCERQCRDFDGACQAAGLVADQRIGPLAGVLPRGKWLILLDSYEQLPEGSDVHQMVQEMQQSLEGSALVIGSRVLPKWADRSAELPVGPMEEEAGKQLAAAAGLLDADCARLCKAVGGLPGALKVGAALAQERGVRAVTKDLRGTAEQIGEELLGDAFSASSETAQKLWTGLCLLPAPVARETAQALCHGQGFDAAWSELVRRKLLDPSAERAELHPLARAIGRARLGHMPEWSQECQRHISRFYADTAESIVADRAALQAELENLLAAAHLAYASQEWEALYALGYRLDDPLDFAGRWTAREDLLRLCYQAAQTTGSRPREGVFAQRCGVLLQQQGHLHEAERLYQQSLEIAREVGNRPGESAALHQLGRAAQDRGQWEGAERLYAQSLAIEREVGNRPGEMYSLGQLGNLALARGDVSRAGELYAEVLQTARSLGDRPSEARTVHNLGTVAQARGQLREAERLYQQSLEIEREVGNRPGEAQSLYQLGTLAQRRGQWREAEQLYEQSLEIAREVSDRPGEATTLAQMAMLAEHQGRLPLAAERMQQALAMLEDMGLAEREQAKRDLERLRKRLAEEGAR